MKVEIRNDRVHISGYVNAVERWSRPITEHGTGGKRFSERIRAGAFADALERNDRVLLMLDHGRVLDDTKSGKFTLREDNIGLRFDGDVFDGEVIAAARKKELVGWSFGFYALDQEDEPSTENGVDFKRTVRKLALDEVSIIDKRMLPAYSATSLEVRGGVEASAGFYIRANAAEVEYIEEAEEEQSRAEEEDAGEPDANEPQEQTDARAEAPQENGEETEPSDYKRAILRKRLEIALKC